MCSLTCGTKADFAVFIAILAAQWAVCSKSMDSTHQTRLLAKSHIHKICDQLELQVGGPSDLYKQVFSNQSNGELY